jgi:sirohydrochlorin ferrochelatase
VETAPKKRLDAARRTALLLIAHGSRRAEANADLEHLAAELRARGPYPVVEFCYLELAEPDGHAGAAQCVRQGAERVLLVPYFLSAGVHVTRDLDQLLGELRAAHPTVEFRLCEPIGRHPLMAEIIVDRARSAENAG